MKLQCSCLQIITVKQQIAGYMYVKKLLDICSLIYIEQTICWLCMRSIIAWPQLTQETPGY